MSNNIKRFNLKSVDLTLPKGFKMEEFVKKQGRESDDDKISVDTDLVHWHFNENGEGLTMEGEVVEGGLKVLKVDCQSEFSGNDYSMLLLPLFREFHGNLEVITTWGDGQREHLFIKNGEVQELVLDD